MEHAGGSVPAAADHVKPSSLVLRNYHRVTQVFPDKIAVYSVTTKWWTVLTSANNSYKCPNPN